MAEQLLDKLSLYNMNQVEEFVAQGFGISIVPKALARDAVSQGRLWAVELPGETSRSWYGIWNKNSRPSLALNRLIDIFRDPDLGPSLHLTTNA